MATALDDAAVARAIYNTLGTVSGVPVEVLGDPHNEDAVRYIRVVRLRIEPEQRNRARTGEHAADVTLQLLVGQEMDHDPDNVDSDVAPIALVQAVIDLLEERDIVAADAAGDHRVRMDTVTREYSDQDADNVRTVLAAITATGRVFRVTGSNRIS